MITDFPTDALAAVDKDDRRPAYTQIADQLRRLILERHVKPGTQLPVEPVLVDRFGVSRMTVREGIRVLRLECLLRTDHGIGVFVATYPGAVPLAGTIRIRTRRPDNPRHRYIDTEVTDSDWQPPVAANLLSSHLEAALDSIGPNQTVTIDIRVDHKPPGDPMTATAAAAATIDGDVRLLPLATNVTSEQMNAQLPEIRDSLARRATAAALAAAHPTITTTDDLDALPAGTVVRSDTGTIACRFDTDHGVVLGDDRPFSPWTALHLPATILWDPRSSS